MAGDEKKALFPDIGADEDDPVTEIESLCMNCHENGMTRLLLTRIPHFKEVIISSFACDHCGYENREIQSGGKIQSYGVKYVLTVRSEQDLNRQVVKSENATFAIPNLDFEQPASKKGTMTTVEGLLSATIEGLQQDQPQRRIVSPEIAEQIEGFIKKLEQLKTLQSEFQIVIDDPAGNSFVENPSAPAKDSNCEFNRYRRSHEQDDALGLTEEEAAVDLQAEGENISKDEVISFGVNCPGCNSPVQTRMKMVDIPFFKEVVIMATTCDVCGLRENEVKGGSGIEEKGTRIKLRVTDPTDLSRDVLKSDTCGLEIPELDLNMEHGTLGGRFTTIEGLLNNIKDQLGGEKNPFVGGDSADTDTKTKLADFVKKLDTVISGELMNVHLIFDDPAGNSYVQNVYAPEADPELEITHYIRNEEQNDFLGLSDMKVENYQENL